MTNNNIDTNISKSQIRKLGDLIRSENYSLSEKTLDILQNYRTSHKNSLSEVFNIVCNSAFKINKEAIITYRIKRFESIIGKLERFPDMEFDRMWDIAGCRCILKNDKEIEKIKLILGQELIIRKINDYISSPKENGYKSLHIYASTKRDSSKIIEIQLRNQTDHNWATLVEITDFLFDEKIKEKDSNIELSRFHFLLSKKSSLNIDEKIEIFEIIRKHQYLEKLNNVFNRNYITVRRQWMNLENKPKRKFYLIETTKDEPPKIDTFDNFIEAEEEYFNRFKFNKNSNILLTHIPKAEFNKISTAYSNYILTFHQFVDDCNKLIEGLLQDAIEKSKYKKFSKYYDFYCKTSVNNINNLNTEINIINDNYNHNPKNIKVKEWVSDIKNQISNIQNRTEKLKLVFRKNKPKSSFNHFVFSQVTKYIANKYRRKIKKN